MNSLLEHSARTKIQSFGALVLSLIVAGCTAIPTSLGPVSVSLQYNQVASLGEFPAAPACASFSSIQVVDSRLNATIGKRYVETNPSVTAPLSTSSDVAGWIKAGAANAAQRGGISQKTSGAILRITVRQIAVSENVARRSGFEGRLLISAELFRKGGGVCWQDRIEGSSENYGYSGSNENYQETLNYALDRAMIRLLSDPGFQKTSATAAAKLRKDALAAKHGEYDVVLANPPFGKKSSVTIVNEAGETSKESLIINRDEFWASTSKCEPHRHYNSTSSSTSEESRK